MLQRSEEWFNERLGIPTASRFSDVMATVRSGEAAARRNYRAELVVERLTGVRAEGYTNAQMQWGIDTEPLARLRYSLQSKNVVEECGFFKHGTLQAGASPDGLIGEDGLLEIKCPLTATHIQTLIKNDIPKEYVAQVQGQLWITGRKWADFVSFDPRLPENTAMKIVRVNRDEEYIKNLAVEVERFIAEVEQETKFLENY